MKAILHIDIDAFFASCEELRNPELINKSVVIASNNVRSVISTANYNARKKGIKAAMPLYIAKNLDKNLTIIKCDMEYYKKISEDFFNLIYQFTKKVEITSIDECYLDVTSVYKKFKTVKNLAIHIKNEIKNKLGINCTIGISHTKFFAKMATNLNKPNNIGILTKDNIVDQIYNLDIIKIHGIGKYSAQNFYNEKIYKIKDLIFYLNDKHNLSDLSEKEKDLYNKLIEYNDDVFTPVKLSKSLSNEITFDKYITSFDELKKHVKVISNKIGNELNIKGLIGKIVRIKVKYDSYKTHTKQIQLNKYIYKKNEIYNESVKLFSNLYDSNKPIRLIGISISNIKYYFYNQKQLNLFDYNKKNISQLDKKLDNINKKYRKKIVQIGLK